MCTTELPWRKIKQWPIMQWLMPLLAGWHTASIIWYHQEKQQTSSFQCWHFCKMQQTQTFLERNTHLSVPQRQNGGCKEVRVDLNFHSKCLLQSLLLHHGCMGISHTLYYAVQHWLPELLFLIPWTVLHVRGAWFELELKTEDIETEVCIYTLLLQGWLLGTWCTVCKTTDLLY